MRRWQTGAAGHLLAHRFDGHVFSHDPRGHRQTHHVMRGEYQIRTRS